MSIEIDQTVKLDYSNKKENEKLRKSNNSSHKKFKYEDNRHFKFSRKRLQSFNGHGKFLPPYKRRKKESTFIPPTKFLLGGNICDPLNLNSMQDEDVNRAMNAVTPKSSPLPTPLHKKGAIEVIIPPNICDPLNLSNSNNEVYENQLVFPSKRSAKKRNRKRKRIPQHPDNVGVNELNLSINSVNNSLKIAESNEMEKKRNNDDDDDDNDNNDNNEDENGADENETDDHDDHRPGSVSGKDYDNVNNNTDRETEVRDEKLVKEVDEHLTKNEVESENERGTEGEHGQEKTENRSTQVMEAPPGEPVRDPKFGVVSNDKAKSRLKADVEFKDKKLKKIDTKDKIVSPVIPQPGAWMSRTSHRPCQDRKKKHLQMPTFKPKDALFQYGNYNRYYGYRNLHQDVDTRLNAFAQRKKLFYDKDVLDIGCNIGHITLSVGRYFSVRSITGIDIDRNLIKIARKNIRHYVNCTQYPVTAEEDVDNKVTDLNFFPMSMPINYGPIDVPGFIKDKNNRGFPHNVTFVQGNYVLENDSLLSLEQARFDVILCLSTTKWLHLNFGDEGLKRSFKRMFAQLKPGGVLILEAQNWSSYGKKKNLTERIFKNYHSIKFFPDQFIQYLLSAEVGFCKCEVVSIPPHPSKGFQRPLHLFTKTSLNECVSESGSKSKNST